jgi:hypothetical protein
VYQPRQHAGKSRLFAETFCAKEFFGGFSKTAGTPGGSGVSTGMKTPHVSVCMLCSGFCGKGGFPSRRTRVPASNMSCLPKRHPASTKGQPPPWWRSQDPDEPAYRRRKPLPLASKRLLQSALGRPPRSTGYTALHAAMPAVTHPLATRHAPPSASDHRNGIMPSISPQDDVHRVSIGGDCPASPMQGVV